MPVAGRLLCPSCQEILVPVDRDGVEIDYCPHCRGVWLDRGELDKILERAAVRMPPTVHTPARGYPERDEHYRKWRDDEYEDDNYRKRKKRKSFLEELFDFD